MDMLCDKEHFK